MSDNPSNGTEPAPMGVADLGGGSGAQPGSYSTGAFVGMATIGNVSAYNASLGADASGMSLQLNSFVTFVDQNITYVYWVQDVALIDTASRDVSFEDNLWNASSSSLNPDAVAGNGTVIGTGPNAYYGTSASCGLPGGCTSLANPSDLRMEINASLNGVGRPQVRFLFDDLGAFTTFDVVSFPWARSLEGPVQFSVSDHMWAATSCPRCYGDVEWVVGGPGNGYQTTLAGSSSIVLSLQWYNGHNLEAVPSSVDYGISTAEGVRGALVTPVSDAVGAPAAALTVGNGSLGRLWNEEQLSALEITVRTGTGSGSASLNGTGVPFSGSFVELLLRPGTVDCSVVSGASTYPLGTLELSPGEALTLEVGAFAAVFVPSGLPNGTLWSVTVGSQTLTGTGNLTFGETAGTYPFRVGSVSGYAPSPEAGNLSVNASGGFVLVQWKATSPGWMSELSGLLRSYWEVLLIAAVILVAIGAAWAIGSRGPVHASARRSPLAPVSPRWMSVCPHCGLSVRADAPTCTACGMRLGPPGQRPPPPL